ncbi:hypothetical protein DWF00_20120 [Bosea caraganae]|uniref:Uncharacterized protein n=1 Tax=Bosea caraganae TaxID=2763117 RepID=A0A370KZ74_9HYPH|nr:hypothetical protein DWE98_25410 [Bosea caraganae]RDJ23998.1 hypothetical protein DWF00_20120 [Bosea caraganae]
MDRWITTSALGRNRRLNAVEGTLLTDGVSIVITVSRTTQGSSRDFAVTCVVVPIEIMAVLTRGLLS